MSLTYTTAVKTARMNALVTAIGTSGKLKLFAADGTTLLASFTLAATAGTVSNGVLTFSDANGGTAGIMNTTASAAGTIAKASITTSADLDICPNTLTVGTSGTDFIIDNPVVTLGQSIQVNTGVFTHS